MGKHSEKTIYSLAGDGRFWQVRKVPSEKEKVGVNKRLKRGNDERHFEPSQT